MKIKEYTCKCGCNDFFFAEKGNQIGIYCDRCGKWLKWADKDEQNLRLKSELQPQPKMGHWIKTISENGVTSAVRCSECGFEDNRYMLFRYCPNCGAKMQGG